MSKECEGWGKYFFLFSWQISRYGERRQKGKQPSFLFLKVKMVSNSAHSQDTDEVFLCFCYVSEFMFIHSHVCICRDKLSYLSHSTFFFRAISMLKLALKQGLYFPPLCLLSVAVCFQGAESYFSSIEWPKSCSCHPSQIVLSQTPPVTSHPKSLPSLKAL